MNFDENNDSVSNKLIVLYIISKVESPISNLQLMQVVLSNKFMNYFLFQQSIVDLQKSNLIDSQTDNNTTFYTVTDTGSQTLEYFKSRIPQGIKSFIDNNLLKIKNTIKNDTFISSIILQNNTEGYIVNCKVQEDNFSLIDLNVTVGSKKDAQIIANNWKNHSQSIYQEIIESLTKKRD